MSDNYLNKSGKKLSSTTLSILAEIQDMLSKNKAWELEVEKKIVEELKTMPRKEQTFVFAHKHRGPKDRDAHKWGCQRVMEMFPNLTMISECNNCLNCGPEGEGSKQSNNKNVITTTTTTSTSTNNINDV